MWWAWGLAAWYLFCVHQVARVAIRATSCVPAPRSLLLLGRRSPRGKIHDHYQARIDRAKFLLLDNPSMGCILSGGGLPHEPSEARLAKDQMEFPLASWVEMEEQSTSTWLNFRNARIILQERGLHGETVAIVTNRYHLARCLAIATKLGLSPVACAAEERWVPSPAEVIHIFREALYLMAWKTVGPLIRFPSPI